MVDYPAVGEIDDPSQVRVMLLQGKQPVHAPLSGLGLQPAGNYQPLDPTLTTVASLTGAADRSIYFTGADVAALYTLTSFARTLLDDADAIAARSTLGVAWELISTTLVGSAVASVDFTGLSAYRWLRLRMYALPATDAVSSYIRTSTNNGSSYDAGATDYQHIGLTARGAASTSASNDAGTTQGHISLNEAIGNAANRGFHSILEFHDFNKAAHGRVQWFSAWVDNGGANVAGSGSFRRVQTTARDACRFLFSSGNVAVGSWFVLEGIRG